MLVNDDIKWEVWCETDNKWVRGILDESTGTPTTCFENNTHTITTSGVKAPSIVERKDFNISTINEGELTKTGKFNLTHVAKDILTGVNSITVIEKFWNFATGALKFSFDVSVSMKGDGLAMYFNKNVVIGAIQADVSPPSAWLNQNYVEGQVVTADTYIGTQLITFTYTCIANTISNEPPRSATTNLINSTYWRKGLRIALTTDQINRVNDGYMAKLLTNPTDPHNNGEYLGKILYVDTTNNYIYVANIDNVDASPLSTTFYAATPTYFATGYQMVGDCTNGPFELNSEWHRAYGDDKIGAAIIPEETVIRVEFHNRDGAAGKRFVGEVEILQGSGTHLSQ